MRFVDAKTAEVDIIDRFGCVVYRYTKRNPNRLSEAELAGMKDRFRAGAASV